MNIQRTTKTETKFYPFTNRFTFSMVMRDPEICKGLLERILPEVDFEEVRNASESTDMEILENMQNLLLSIETEKELDLDPNAHGVRFDALVKTTKQWVEIEMQTYSGEDIGKRSRYYLSNVDMDALEKGAAYSALPPTYIIFICTFDYMKQGRPVYFFQRYDIKNDLPLDDETYIMILNTNCDAHLVPEQLKPLFAYINDSSQIQDEFIQRIEDRVQRYNSREWRRVQVTLEQMLQDEIRRGIEEGMAEALAKVREEALAEAREKVFAEVREKALAEARAEVLAEGHAEGTNSAKSQIALNLLAEGLPLALIAKATGLSQDEIKRLQK